MPAEAVTAAHKITTVRRREQLNLRELLGKYIAKIRDLDQSIRKHDISPLHPVTHRDHVTSRAELAG